MLFSILFFNSFCRMFDSLFFYFNSLCGTIHDARIIWSLYYMDYLLLALPTIPNVFSCTATVPHSDSPFSQLWWLPPFQVCMLQFYISHSACLLFFFLFASSMSHEIHMVTISVAMQDNNSNNNNKRGRARSHEPHRKQPSSTCLLNVWKRMWMQSIWCRVNGTNTHN